MLGRYKKAACESFAFAQPPRMSGRGKPLGLEKLHLGGERDYEGSKEKGFKCPAAVLRQSYPSILATKIYRRYR